MRILLKTGASLTALSLLLPAASANAEDITLSLEAAAGVVDNNAVIPANDDNFSGGLLGSANFDGPVTFQVDGLAFEHRENSAFGGALHLGTSTAGGTYLGLYGSVSDIGQTGGLQTTRFGGEVDHNFGDFRLSLVAGYEDIDDKSYLVSSVPTLRVFEEYGDRGVFAFSDLIFQPGGDGFSISAGHRYVGGHHALAVGTAVPLTGRLSLTGHARMGGADYSAALLGLRLVFGGEGSNEDNLLQNRLMEDLFAPGNTRRLRNQVIVLPPPPDDGGEGCCGGYCEA